MSNPENSKAVAEAMMGLWKGEFPATVRVLSAVRDETRDYRPDETSRTAWQIAIHIATSDLWFLESVANGEFHFDPDVAARAEEQLKDVSAVVAMYEEKIPAAVARFGEFTGEELAEEVDFFGMMKMSRAAWIGFANNHSVHHRGQLSAYLRGLGSKVPSIYGQSGDSE